MEGYDKFAAFISSDDGMSIYRRFSSLNTKNLLYLQAEISNLEAQLKNIITQDKESQHPLKAKFPFSVWELKHFEDDEECLPTQWEKILEIRKLLTEYSEPFNLQIHSTDI